MAHLINIGLIDKNFIFPVVLIICTSIDNYFMFRTSILDNFINHILIRSICQSLGKCLSLIPFFIFKRENQKLDKKNEIKTENKLAHKKDNIDKNKRSKKKLLIVLTSLIEVGNSFVFFKLYNISFNFYIFDIIFVSIFSFYILKVKLYKHQFLSMIIIIIFGLIHNIFVLIYDDDKDNTFTRILLRFINEIFFCLNVVINKYLMDKEYCSPYELCSIKGIISLIIFIILFSIITNVEIKIDYYTIKYKDKYYIDNFYDYIDNINIKEVFIFIAQALYYFLYNLFYLITIKDFTSSHSLIIFVFQYNIFKNDKKWRVYTNVIIIIIIFFMLLIFNDIIELNFMGLQINTKKNIIERAKKELIEESIIRNSISSSTNDDGINDEDEENQVKEIDGYRYELVNTIY